MIYHNYSPYYYGSLTNLNKKIANNNNSQPKNSQKIPKNNYYNSNFTPPQFLKENTDEYLNQKKIPPKSNNDVIFEIFGIKLYFDDILLICLIFFLYNEGVQDQYLFIALILLLLS